MLRGPRRRDRGVVVALPESYSAHLRVGEPVFCKVDTEQWERSDPSHQVVCRIMDNGEEIYICTEQGTPDRGAKAECGGPVYIPQKNQNR